MFKNFSRKWIEASPFEDRIFFTFLVVIKAIIYAQHILFPFTSRWRYISFLFGVPFSPCLSRVTSLFIFVRLTPTSGQ